MLSHENLIKSVDPEIVLLKIKTLCESTITEKCNRSWSLFIEKKYFCAAACAQVLLDISWEELNTGHWKDVDIAWRYLYTFASLIKCVYLVHSEHFKEAIKTCDLGLMLGAPLFENILSKIAAEIVRLSKNATSSSLSYPEPLAKKGKVVLHNIPTIKNGICQIKCPSLMSFKLNFLDIEKPVIITNSVDHWPAMSKWSVQYLKETTGMRLIPVEIGDKYTSENWTQKLITMQEFIDQYILSADSTGYLAQHQLFEQVPELRNDIAIPDYCYLSEKDECDVMTNAWFGPAGTVSPLHHDPYHNLFVQVLGEKYIRLYNKNLSAYLYPNAGTILDNTSQVDVESYDHEKFPKFEQASYVECIIKPGEMLYIPPKWWHYVRSLKTSFSVSFWWD